MNVIEGVFGSLNGKNVKSYTIKTDNGMELTCIEYGCIITEINVRDREEDLENIVLGFDTIEEYINHSPYFGCIIGRTAGRIENASFQLDGVSYELPKNDGVNNLHGGPHGFHNAVWESSVEAQENEVNITFSHTSPDGEEGFPGNLQVTVIYTVNNANELTITYRAVSDKKTVVNLTNHSYFNLSGNLKRTVLDHELILKSDSFLELDSSLIPTGKILPVEGTVFDFRKGRQILQGVESEHPQTKLVGGGYDHPFLLNDNHQKEISLLDRESGRKIDIETDEPCVVLYTGNMLEGHYEIRGKQSNKYLGLCLETQKPPNMMDHPDFPSSILEENQVYTSKTKYSFTLI